jgi:hypothetical protein
MAVWYTPADARRYSAGLANANARMAIATSQRGTAGKWRRATLSIRSAPNTAERLEKTKTRYWSPIMPWLRSSVFASACSRAGKGPQYR